jgi:type I restriction enzyme, S subunit
LPPHDEQVAIVHHLESATAAIETAINHAQREIALIREYRTRLIADVVTGKLDVRDAAAKLPDESEEPVAPDVAEVLVEGEGAGDEALEAVEVGA